MHDGAAIPDLSDFYWNSVDLQSVLASDCAITFVNPAWNDALELG